jgi:hypothetical protein
MGWKKYKMVENKTLHKSPGQGFLLPTPPNETQTFHCQWNSQCKIHEQKIHHFQEQLKIYTSHWLLVTWPMKLTTVWSLKSKPIPGLNKFQNHITFYITLYFLLIVFDKVKVITARAEMGILTIKVHWTLYALSHPSQSAKVILPPISMDCM